MKIVERVRLGDRGKGTLLRYAGVKPWAFSYYQSGREHRVTTGTEDLKQAKRFAKQRLAEVSADQQGLKPLATPVSTRVTVQTLLDQYLADVVLRGLKSAAKVVENARPIAERFGPMRAVDVTAAGVDKYITEKRTAGLQPATINRRLQILHAALKLAVERKLLVEAPKIRRLSEVGNARQGFFEEADLERLLPHLPEHLRDLTTFAYATGWRRSEITALRWDMIADNVLVLPTSKNGRPRRLPIAGAVAEILARREKARLCERGGEPQVAEYVFHYRGRRLHDFKRAWAHALVRAGLPHLLFHDLRRSAARRLVRQGVPQVTAMKLLGHKTDSMYRRYAIVSDGDLREVLERDAAGVTA